MAFMGKDGFVWWIGVVEERKDPKYLGRCKVRVLGWHTKDKNDTFFDKINRTQTTIGKYQLMKTLINPIDNIMTKLNNVGIISDWREPDVIRIAPVPLYNSFEECFLFVQSLEKIINE